MSAGLFNTLAREAEFKLVLNGAQEHPDSGVVALVASQATFDGGVTDAASLAGLAGKRIGVTAPGSVNQYATARALEAAGIDPVNGVEWVTGIGQPDMIGALGDSLDAANFAVDVAAGAVRAEAGQIIVRGNEVTDGMQVLAFAMSNDFIENNRDAAERFAMAYIRGAETYNEALANPSAFPEVMAAMGAHTNAQTAENVLNLLPWVPWVDPTGRMNVASIMEQQDYWADVFGTVDTKVDEATVIDESILDAALQRLGR
jgi:ABC-type nitrate/sulfonate/bicarbonate transport system substrate-binding protein